jgi:hypothetical protein
MSPSELYLHITIYDNMTDERSDERVGADGEAYFDPDEYQEQFEHDEFEPVVLGSSGEEYTAHKPDHPPKEDVISGNVVPFESATQLSRDIITWCDECFPQKSYYGSLIG